MFVMTLRKGKIKKVGIACACGAIVLAAAIGVNSILAGSSNDSNSLEAVAMVNLEMSSADDLVTFLHGYGVEADVATATVSTVTVPKKWDDSFVAFNEVIKESNLTLEKSKGKQVEKWSLLIPSQSTEDSKMYAIVLVQESQAVAAYLLEKPSGEVLALSHAAQTALPLTQDEISEADSFGEDAEVIVVNDGTTQELTEQSAQEVTTQTPAASEVANLDEAQITAEQGQEAIAPVTPYYDEATMPTD